MDLIVATIETVKNLLENGYPEREKQIAREEVIQELNDRLSMLELAVKEFEIGPKAILTVSTEIKS